MTEPQTPDAPTPSSRRDFVSYRAIGGLSAAVGACVHPQAGSTTPAPVGSAPNVFWRPRAGEPMVEFGVDVLQARGAQLLMCNNVFRGVIRGAMRETGRSYAEVRAELKAGFLPGVIVVPAMVAAMAMAQSRGSAYVFAGV